MLLIRSVLFNISFYLYTFLLMLVMIPVFFLPRKLGIKAVPLWTKGNFFLLKYIGGVNSEVLNGDRIPQQGCIIASKHQSAWETFAFMPWLNDPTYILKAELRKVPFFGWYLRKFDQIPVNRGRKGAAMQEMTLKAKEAIADGRHIIIFPEGTRRPAAEEPKYKYGITHLYLNLNCPVVPIGLNSGVYWPRRRFFRFPGTITAQVMEPIEPGLSAEEFNKRLQAAIEGSSQELFEKAARETPDNIIVKEGRERLAQRNKD
ncbi:lysophospholipid acyltransferase family protein [Polycladidibacter hongkongensis]|uniref:lysophospholipid acyltransferase family protein n=1 Tax=Polycladidibacter hongkongensis TaxID=1647556 RepID=UPI000833D476|nr:lysophospholipid acyltransferase family protein [Pseudovibrio hongkongensis]